MCVHIHINRYIKVHSCTFFYIHVSVYEHIHTYAFLRTFFSLGAGCLDVGISLETSNIDFLSLHNHASYSSMVVWGTLI